VCVPPHTPLSAFFFITHLRSSILLSLIYTREKKKIKIKTCSKHNLFLVWNTERELPFCFTKLSFMALLTSLPEHSTTPKRHKRQPQQQQQQQQKQKQKQKQKPGSSWDQIKNLLTCKQVEGSRVHDPSKGYSKIGSSCSSICSFRDVVHGNTRVVHRSDNSSPESSSLGQETGLLTRKPVTGSTRSTPAKSNAGTTYTSSSSSSSSSSRGMQFRKLSGCYECHMIIDPSRYYYTVTSN